MASTETYKTPGEIEEQESSDEEEIVSFIIHSSPPPLIKKELDLESTRFHITNQQKNAATILNRS